PRAITTRLRNGRSEAYGANGADCLGVSSAPKRSQPVRIEGYSDACPIDARWSREQLARGCEGFGLRARMASHTFRVCQCRQMQGAPSPLDFRARPARGKGWGRACYSAATARRRLSWYIRARRAAAFSGLRSREHALSRASRCTSAEGSAVMTM